MQRKISTKEMFKGPIFTMSKDEVEIKGCIYERDVIHHHGGVGVLAIQDDKILFVKQYRYAVQDETLEIPAGKLEENENPYTCGLRELEEESGHTTKKLNTLCEMYSTPGFCSEKIYIYWTDSLIPVENPLPMDDDEEIELVWLSIHDAYQAVLNGNIKDAKTILAVQYAYIHFTK